MGHLILTRGPHEAIKIGDDVEIRVMNVKGNQVRLGITAPPDCVVMRPEAIEKQARAKDDETDK